MPREENLHQKSADELSLDSLHDENIRLKNQLNHYKLICDFSIDWEFWIKPNGEFNYISPSCKTLTGYTSSEFFNDPGLFYSVIVPGDRVKVKEFITKTLNFTLLGEDLNFQIKSRTKQVKWCEMSMRAIYDSIGNYLGQRGSIKDISKLRADVHSMDTINKPTDEVRFMYGQRERELSGSLIKMAQKNELLAHIKKQLEALSADQPGNKRKLESIMVKIDRSITEQGHWEEFKSIFERNHPHFFQRLNQVHSNLTPKDVRLCSYLRLQLSSKEISRLLNITPKSVEVSRTRLRSKLKIDRKINLSQYLQQI